MFTLAFLVIILGSNLVSAEDNLLHYKTYDKDKELVSIKTLIGTKIIDLELLDNTNSCLIDCYATIKVTPYKDLDNSKLDYDKSLEEYNFKFYDEINKKINVSSSDKLRDIKLEIQTYEWERVEDYTNICYPYLTNITVDNVTKELKEVMIGNCSEEWISYHLEPREVYKPFNINTYDFVNGKPEIIKISANKKIGENIEWIPTFFGFEIIEWAWWNDSYPNKRNISCINMSDGTPLVINGSAGFNINGDKQVIWTYCMGEISIYYDTSDSTVSVAVVNISNITLPHEYELGNGTSNNPSGIWGGFVRVFHQGEGSGTNMIDSTGTENLTLNQSDNWGTGIIGSGYDFDGTDDRAIGTNPSSGVATFTAEWWIRRDTDTGTYEQLSDVANSNSAFHHDIRSTDVFYWQPRIGGVVEVVQSVQTCSLDTEYYWVTRYNGSLAENIINNSQDGTNVASGSMAVTSVAWNIATRYDFDRYFSGLIDEIRISNSVRSDAYISEVFNNKRGISGFGTLGVEENVPAGNSSSPVVNLNSPADNNWSNDNTPNFIFNVTDADNLTLICNLLINGTGYGFNNSVLNNTETTITANHSITPDNTNYLWNITCTDGTNQNNSVRHINIDTNSPNIILNSPADNNLINNNVPTFTFNYTDSLSPNATCELIIDDVGYGFVGSLCYQETANITSGCGGLNTGVYSFNSSQWSSPYSLYDGNWTTTTTLSNYPYGANFYVNYTKPSGSTIASKWEFGMNSGWRVNLSLSSCWNGYSNKVVLRYQWDVPYFNRARFFCHDNSSWILLLSDYPTSYYMSEEAMWWDMSSATTNNTELTITANHSLSDGEHNWSINCTDLAGNIGNSSAWNLTTDTTAPVVNITAPANNTITNDNTPTFTFNYTESLSGNVTCTLYINNTARGTNNSVLNYTSTNITSNTTLTDGIHNWNIRCTDLANNIGESGIRSIIIDVTPPVINLHLPPNNTWTSNTTPLFNFTAVDSGVSTLACTHYFEGTSYYHNTSIINNTANTFTPNATLPDGNHTWYINCSDGANINQSDVLRLYIITSNPLILSFNIEPSTIYSNISSNANITATTTLGIIKANLSCYVNSSSILNESNVSLINNTGYDFTTIDGDNYSAGDNLSCNVTVYDQAGNTNTSIDYVIISDTAPSPPNDINFSTGAFYYNYLTSFNANGSTDIDNDTITYYFRVYNLNDSVERQAWSTQNNYTPIVGDAGDTLRVSAKATTTSANSSSYNETLITYLSFMTLFLVREKTNLPLNISGADEVTVSIICSDDVTTINITSNTTNINISCAYEFIKTDATYGNTSYFRIINPSYTSFSNTTIYMLDLNHDTGVEIILNINDLTGDYSSGEVIIQRYINNSQVIIISQPFDIEASATLYLLKDMLYTVSVKNNDGETRVIGNLIASSPGTKTLTLPEISFLPDDAIVGDEVNWYYTYNRTSFIQLVYSDTNNQTTNTSFIIMNENDTSTAIFSGYTTNSSRLSFTYGLPNYNLTYLSNLTINHPVLGRVFEQRVYTPIGAVLTPAETGLFPNISIYLFWMSLIFVFIIGLVFSARSSKVGLVAVMFFLLMFMLWGWISFGAVTWVVFGLFVVLTILNFISKSKEVKE